MSQRSLVGIAAWPAALLSLALLAAPGVRAVEEQQHHHGLAPAGTADPHAQHRAMLEQAAPSSGTSTEVKLHDEALLTQDGERVKFASEVIGERIVVMDFVYTTCTTVCPVLSAVFTQVQDRLGDRLGQEVLLVSVSVDPTRDTPARLKAYAARHQAQDRWIWLTGEKPRIDQVLTGLGAYAPRFEDHPAMVLVGDGRSGSWVRFFGFPGPDQIVAAVDQLVAARQAATVTPSTLQE
jgi:protein SCO1/2